jgi:hypothetical protein
MDSRPKSAAGMAFASVKAREEGVHAYDKITGDNRDYPGVVDN